MPNEKFEAALRRLAALTKQAELIGATRYDDVVDMLELLRRNPCNSGLARAIECALDDVEEEQRLNPNPLARPPEAHELSVQGRMSGPAIGKTTETDVPCGPRLDDARLIAVTGVPGGGKTTAVGEIVQGVLASMPNVAVLMLDPKRDTSHLLALGHPQVRVVKAHEIRFNPLHPPAGMELRGWLNILATHFSAIRGLIKSRHLLLDSMIQLCTAFGVDKNPSKPWPSLYNVLEYLERLPRAFGKDDYRQSLITELHGLLDETENVFDTSNGIDIERDMLAPGGLFALQTEMLPVNAQQLIATMIVEHVVNDGLIRNVHAGFERIVVLDEAQLVLSRAADLASSNGLAPLASQLLRGREMGVGFIVVAHLLTEISRAVLASAKTMMVVGGLSDAGSIEVAAHMMSLPAAARTMFPRLGRGQAIVREIGAGAYTDAFLVDVNPPAIAKDAIDEATRQQLMQTYVSGLPSTPSKPLSDYPAVMAAMNPTNAGKRSPARMAAPTSPGPATVEHSKIILDAIDHRDDYNSERLQRLNTKDYADFDEACKWLKDQNLLEIHSVRLGSQKYNFLQVLDLGFQFAGRPMPPGYLGRGGGSFVHVVLGSRTKTHLKKAGWTNVQTEKPVGGDGHPVDVFGVSPTGVATAFEVTLSTGNVVTNALKTLTPPTTVQQLVFLCTVDKDCKAVERMLKQNAAVRPYLAHIRFERIDRYIS